VLIEEDTVRVEEAVAVLIDTEAALNAHVGDGVPPPLTLQDSDTVPA
jgi:hypothetical protein